jgi:hypothetical protein
MHLFLSLPAYCLFLESQQHYYTCQIKVPDIERPLAAIRVRDEYYSFFRLIKDSDEVLLIVNRLTHSGDRLAIVKKANGYSLWVLESDAIPKAALPSTRTTAQKAPPDFIQQATLAPSKLLTLSDPCYPAHIKVPDLDQPVKAIAHNNRYYSLFRMEHDTERVISILIKTARRGEETIVVETPDGYAVCVIEPVADLL